MAALDVDVFRSKQFVFVVGENQAEFAVHAAIIAKQSKTLDILINGSMKEASDGKAIFEDVQEDTFIRFCQFAYTGDYTTPDFELPDMPPPTDASITDHDDSKSIEPEPDAPGPAPGPAPEPEPVPEQPVDHDFGWRSKSLLLRQSLNNQFYNREPFRTNLAARCLVRQNLEPMEDYTTVFLGHAQLYVFAEKWGIDALKTLVLFKLHETLTSFTLYAVRRQDIVELLRYTFSNDHTPDRVEAMDDLRSLVMLYTTCEVEGLVLCPEFLSLIGEGGQLAQNLVQMLIKRID